ncbi:NAD(P)H-dependent oxidoreductase [Thermosediminibacter litoriperuensis]|uniref:Putative homoserine dehydrogenase-like protein n=1 Tax=Thermosediminibacter litoriperuensis TaxID=291989 RepID=A0A5S5AV74_9FIRM|nr:SAF domain-containing protein [Thermosediminibacter litoriperuensis]TYP56784.1 putative homoserine dehydrogenase-like protein [Thermosediminibacter litoriperuensis]
MLNLNSKLRELEASGKKINVGLIGAGQMGRGMVSQIFCMKGIRVAAICDTKLKEAKRAYTMAGVAPDDVLTAKTPSEVEEALGRGKYAITEDLSAITRAIPIDVVVDATGVPEVGAQIALDSIYNGKHIVMLNVETDVTVGPILKKMADSAGVVYTVSAGDEPGAIKELYDFADAMGFEILVAGKGKNNPLDLEANPDSVMEEAMKKNMNPKMLASFKDGTKTMVELTAVSNATGFLPTRRGLIGPKATVKELPEIFRLKEEGGILDRYQVVEYVNGVAPGVFVIVTTKLEAVREEMAYLSMGKGPNYVFYRPYHLTSIETPLSAARAYIYKEPTIAPKGLPVSETIAVAKKDLKAGEHLDGIGGFTVYGVIDTYENAKKENALPIGLVNKNVVMTKDVKKGQVITYDAVKLDENSIILQLRRMQEKLIG